MDAFDVHQLGLYLQDQWTPVSGLTLTGGLRFDVPYLPTTPGQNPALAVRAPGHQYRGHAQRQPPLVAPARLQL